MLRIIYRYGVTAAEETKLSPRIDLFGISHHGSVGGSFAEIHSESVLCWRLSNFAAFPR